MKRVLMVLIALACVAATQRESQAQNRRNRTLPKVDLKINSIRPVGQGLAISVTNSGFVMSPKSGVSVAIYDGKTRQLLSVKSLSLQALQPNQTSRVIFVPPAGKSILVRAKVDPGNKIPELNERNNELVTRH